MNDRSPLPPSPEDAQALADAVAAAMGSRDRAAHALGISIDAVGPGRARLSMAVRGDMLNGHGMCHGGLIFTLADTAFAYACNSRDLATVASACHIDFVAPAQEGETLVADAAEQALAGRTGVYDVRIETAAGRTIALFRGKSHRIAGSVIDGLGETAADDRPASTK